jgi:hypothetical protein
MAKRLCKLEERACALQGKYTAYIQSDDGSTMFAGLATLMRQLDFNAHLHREGDYWCAMVSSNTLDHVEGLSERLATIGPVYHHWVRLMVWEEERQTIVFDRSYTRHGDMQEPVPA